jgi:hypothetical protein
MDLIRALELAAGTGLFGREVRGYRDRLGIRPPYETYQVSRVF